MNKTARDFAENLVLEVQKRPAIYVASHPNHKDRYEIDMEWTSIAAQLNSTVEVVKRRWQNLRGSFSKSLAALKNQPSGSATTPKPAFYLFEQMKFLQHHMAHSQMHGKYWNVEELFVNSQEIGDDQPVEELTKEEVDSRLETPSSPNPSTSCVASTTSGALRRKRSRQEQSRHPWEVAEGEYMRNITLKEDSDLNFFKGLLPMVRGLKPKNKLKFFAEAASLLSNHIQQQDAEDLV